MDKEQRKEYSNSLKEETKKFLDSIGTDSDFGQRIIKLIYGFARSGFMEYNAGKGGAE